MHRLLTGSGEDVLQLNLTLYHAYKALSARYKDLALTTTPPPIYPAAAQVGEPIQAVTSCESPELEFTLTDLANERWQKKTGRKQAAAHAKATRARDNPRPGTFTCPISPCSRNDLERSGLINHL